MKTTPLNDIHAELGGRLVDFNGWQLPLSFAGILAEHEHCRKAVSLFDTGHMGLFRFAGTGAAAWFAQIGTQDAPGLLPGKGRYGFLLNEAGGVLDDTILFRMGADEFILVVNAGTAQSDFGWIEARREASLTLENLSQAGWSKLDVQGPLAYEVLNPLVNGALRGLAYFGIARLTCLGHEVLLSRTGYTGELGYEVMGPGACIRELYRTLLKDSRALPAGLGARDSLRLEMAYPLYGHELDTQRNPIEAGLEVFAPAGGYIGAKALERVRAEGPARRLVAFVSDSRRKPAPGDALTVNGERVGEVTSGAFLTSLALGGGMGYVDAACATPGTELVAVGERNEIRVRVETKPLYKHGTCRMKLEQ